MKREHVLVLLVVLDVLLAFAVIGSEMFFTKFLPDGLRDHVVSQLRLPTSLWDGVLFVLWTSSICLTLAAWIGFLNLWWFARRLYAIAWTNWTLLVLFSGPSVLTPVGAMFNTLESLVGGLILGLVYFSDLSRYFERSQADIASGARATT